MLNAPSTALQRWRVVAYFANQGHEPPMVRACPPPQLLSASLPFTVLEKKGIQINSTLKKSPNVYLGTDLIIDTAVDYD